MSTKLYGGLKLKDPATDIFELIPRIAEAIEPAFTSAARELVGEELLAWIDSPSQWPEEDKRTYPLFDAERAWRKRQQAYGSHHALNDPLRFSIVFGRSSAGNLLAYPFYSEDCYRKALKKLRIFEDYHYQNSSDKPKGISKRAWNQRSEEWDSLLGKDGTLGNLPMWEFGKSEDPYTEVFMRGGKSFDANSYGSLDGRLKSLLVGPLVGKIMEELESPQDQIFRIVSEAQSTLRYYLQTPEGSAVPRPAPVPKGSSFEYSDLEPYTVSSGLLDEILRVHLERRNS